MDKKPQILLVDDDSQIRSSLKAILEDEGYVVECAASGEEAIEKTNQTAYNLAILDIRLPDIEGTELLPLLKEVVPRTRKIMVTGYPSLKNAIASLNNKADFYLIKPVDIGMLLAVIKDQLADQKNEEKHCREQATELKASMIPEERALSQT